MALVLDGNGTMTVGNGAVSGITTPISLAQGGTARANIAYFYATLSADSSGQTASTWAKVPLNSATIDNVGGFSSANNRYTIQSGYAGYYSVNYRARVRYSSGTQANQIYVGLYKNGSLNNVSETDLTGNYMWTTSLGSTLILNLAVGDYLELYGYATNMSFLFRGGDSSLTLTQLYGV